MSFFLHVTFDVVRPDDGGASWELLEALLVQHLPQLQVPKICRSFCTEQPVLVRWFGQVSLG